MFENERKVIIIDDIKNSNIQQAIFILKDKTKTMENYNIIDEANSIIYQYISRTDKNLERSIKKKRRFFGKGKH